MSRLLARFAPSLVLRLALAFGLVGLVPVGLLAYRLIGLNRDSMDQQVVGTHLMFARSAAEQVSSLVSTRLLLARTLAANPALGDPASTAARTMLRDNLQSWAAFDVLAIAVVDVEGRSVITAQLRDDTARRHAAPALELAPGADVEAVAVDEVPVVRVSARLAAAEGFVWVVAAGDEILEALESFELGEGQVEVALTTTGGVDLVGSSAGFPDDVRQEAATGHLQGVDASFVDPRTGVDLIGAYAPVRHTDWIVYSRQPTALAHRTARDMTRQAQIAVGLVAVAIGLLSVFAYVTVVRPIRELAQAQRRLAGLGGGAGQGDEIDQLRASFKALESRLRDQKALDEVFLGRYQILELLGTGAMGSVFLGRDPKLERQVAIKTVRLGRTAKGKERRELVARLLQEAIITAKLNHPNVVAIYDVEDARDAAFVAMEYVDGINLEQLVWKLGRIDPELTLPLGAAVARGLAVAHEAKLVHRDVKPANILLGRDGAIKVVDFGIAELLSSVAAEEDVVFGTPGYVPPETLRGKGYDEAGDLFSLGAVLYFGLTGRRAFEGKNLKEIVRKTLFETPPRPSLHATGVPAELDELIQELLTSDRRSRPSDADQVADRLEAMARRRDAVWRLPAEAFEKQKRVASQTTYLPTTSTAVAGKR